MYGNAIRLFLLVIVASVACLGGMVAQDAPEKPRISTADRQKRKATTETMRSLGEDLRTYHSMYQEYPEALDALKSAGLREELPKDGWERDFVYERSEEHGFRLISRGSDGQEAGEGGAEDIVWTRNGLYRELTDEERDALASKREEQKHTAFHALALARMVVLGEMLLEHRKTTGDWPEKLETLKPTGTSSGDTAKSLCFNDPWGYEFSWRRLPHDNFALVCFGEDGKEGGTARAADFSITEREVRFAPKPDESRPWRTGGTNDWYAQDLARSVGRYKKEHETLPDALDELTAGAQPLRASIPQDRWDRDYLYVVLGDDEFYVIGLGEDGRPGGFGDAADIIVPKPGTIPFGGDERGFGD